MSNVSFELCPYEDSTGFKLKDTTGVQPSSSEGYPSSADLSLYVGEVSWVGDNDVLLSNQPVDVNGGSFQLFELSIPDGIYEVTYKVTDDNGAEYGECTVIVLIDKNYSSDVNNLLAETNRCEKCRSEILKSLSNARRFIEAAEILAIGGDLLGAHDAWNEGIKVIQLQNCRC